MNTDFAFVCDYAEAGQKINALGIGFDTLYVQKTPMKHGHFSFVMQIRTSTVEAGLKRIEIHIIDDDGKEIIPSLKATLKMEVTEGRTEAIGRIVLEFGNVEFPNYGTYTVKAAVEGIEMSSVSFEVSPPPNQQA